MERVNHLLQRLLGNQRFKQRYEQMKRYILEHPDVQPVFAGARTAIVGRCG